MRRFSLGKAASGLVVLYTPEVKTLNRPRRANPNIRIHNRRMALYF
jgi:hypothetical protein